ncbi:MAG: hypothetical protein QCH96_00925 [Candidatus Thermoplasmatota archaeon]|jgi:hypothetical protein|nr:hypothetical protein [Candidatus Thermoplasmatota archaeon]
MCNSCGCEADDKPVQYKCDCNDEDCNCDSIIGFDEVPNNKPYCCGVPMKRTK